MKGVLLLTINYVLDTNVILHDPLAFKHFGEHHVVIPAYVLEELETKKKEMTKVGDSARTFVRELMKIREESNNNLGDRIDFDRPNGGSFVIEMSHQAFQGMGDFTNRSIKDNRILAVAKNVCTESSEQGQKTVLVTMDALMIAKADVLSKKLPKFPPEFNGQKEIPAFQAQLYRYDRLVESSDSIHTGVHHISVPDDAFSAFYKEHAIQVSLIEECFTKEYFPNDFVVLTSSLSKSSGMGRIRTVKGKLCVVPFINGNHNFSHVTPRNSEQTMLAEALTDSTVDLVLVRGEAGSGKTLLALASSIWMMESKGNYNYKKLLVGRPIVEMGKGIGFLPGELEAKMKPWMAPIYDNLEYYFRTKNQAELETLLAKKEFLEIQALAYIRGRSIPDQLIIIDEAQNLTPHEVKTIITRAGKGTKVILIGDTKQIDHAYLDEINNGLTYAIERMKGEESVAVLKLEKTERSPLADLAVKYL